LGGRWAAAGFSETGFPERLYLAEKQTLFGGKDAVYSKLRETAWEPVFWASQLIWLGKKLKKVRVIQSFDPIFSHELNRLDRFLAHAFYELDAFQI
jgi:hypothetical protein